MSGQGQGDRIKGQDDRIKGQADRSNGRGDRVTGPSDRVAGRGDRVGISPASRVEGDEGATVPACEIARPARATSPALPQGEGEGCPARSAESPRARANREQLLASDPAASAFVAASAGSGKTKLLTDRLLRLMLAGAKPERIQCLTFTKAAAAEMAVRLQRILGTWVTLPSEELAAELRRLQIDPTDQALTDARALFARVLDLPGGMRIGTIHAFCQSLLRRFPLEAALSPHFQLVDEYDADAALTDAREAMLARADTPALRDALAELAGLASATQFGRQVEALQANRDRLAAALALPDLAAAQRRALRITAATEAEIIAAAVNWQAEPDLRNAATLVHQRGAKTCAERAGRILAWLGLDADDRVEHWAHWCTEFLTGEGKARADGGFVNKALLTQQPDLAPVFQAECTRILTALDDCRALRLAALSGALLTLAGPVLRAYAAHKENSGLLDYEDLIGRTSALLRDPGVAWVLYKLDGGLDHLLLDEVQDTAPAQWAIAHALTEEFFAGTGAREENRTVFAVGDRKQSIYSFQGADADEFDRARATLARRVRQAEQLWRETPLDVSFRSTRPVLDLVDRVFADPTAAAGVVEPGQMLQHLADRADHAGSVELWPLAPLPDAADPPPWSVADANHGLQTGPQLLAETLAEWIRQQTAGDVLLESKGRPLAPGDVMVLVRRRNDFARALVRALKARDVPVAGLDRLVLTEQPAVQDLMALADALLLPQDDLNFACLLTSPLGGLNDGDLMALSEHRRAPLWETLRARAAERPHWQRAWDFFAVLQARVDYVSPYMLLAEALGPLGGRARLYARLGPRGGGAGGRAAERRPRIQPRPSARVAGLPALAAPVRRRGEAGGGGGRQPGAGDDGARRQGAAGAAGHPAGHHGAAAGRWCAAVGGRSADRRCRAAVGAAQGIALCRGRPHPRRRCAAADGGAQPSALRRADPGRRPVAGVRLADPAGAAGYLLVQSGRQGVRRAGRGDRAVRRLGRSSAPRHAADRRPRPAEAGRRRRAGSAAARLAGQRAGLAARAPTGGTRPARAAGAQPARGGRAWAHPVGCLAAGRTGGAGRPVPSRPVVARAAATPAGAAARTAGGGGAAVAGPAGPRHSRRCGRGDRGRGHGDPGA